MQPEIASHRRRSEGKRALLVLLGLGSVILFGLTADKSAEPSPSPREASLPIGSIIAFAGPATAIPEAEGWLLCDGRELPIQGNDRLFAALQYAWGRGAGPSAFRIPDLRGRFLRGVDLTSDVDRRDPDRDKRTPSYPGGNAGNQVGSVQPDEFVQHSHSLVGAARAVGAGDATVGQWLRFHGSKIAEENTPDMVNETAVLLAGGSETRPKNVSVNWIIRAR
jgi:microcystin-dependent protein